MPPNEVASEPSLQVGNMITIGFIGMGEMGKMYARRISAAGWR